MANFFESIFNRNMNVNVYANAVDKPISFEELSFEQLEQLYITLPDTRIIEDFISDNIAKIEVKVVNSRDNEVKNTSLNQLLEEVNLNQSWREFIKEAFVSYGLTGNMFIHRMSETGYLYNLSTSNTSVNLAKDKTLPEYLNYVGSYTQSLGGRDYNLLSDTIFHLKTASLLSENGLWSLGTSPYQSGTKNIKTLNATYSSRVSTIADRGALGFITNESELPDADESRLVQDALETYGTKEEQKKFIVTTQKLKYNQMAMGVSELKYLENLNHDFKALCQLRGLDPLIFSSEGSTYANQAEARKASLQNVIIPLTDKFYSKFNEWIRPFYNGLRLLPNYESLPEYGNIDTTLSTKLINEVNAGLITKQQASEILYPELEYIEPQIIEQADDNV